jgi:ribosomal protein S18 acetylase RimI-like enzyme
MKIRSYQPDDCELLIELWKGCGLVVPQNDPRKDIQRKVGEDHEMLLLGEIAGKIVASVMVGYEGHRGWINYLAVAPGHRKQGLGRMMMDAAEQLLLGKGCPKINLQIRSSNEEVKAFYNAIGYTQDPVLSMGKRLIKDD